MDKTLPGNPEEQIHLTLRNSNSLSKINLSLLNELATENPIKVFTDYCAFLVLEGHGNYEDSNGFSSELKPGSYVQHIPGLYHVVRRSDRESWTELSFRISPEPAEWLIGQNLITLDPPVRQHREWPYRAEKFIGFMKELQSKGEAGAYRRALSWLLQWIEEMERVEPDLLEKMKLCLGRNLSARIREEDLLADLDYSYGYLRLRFKEETGETPRVYREKRRIGEAEALLETRDVTVAATADVFGYSDPFVFSRAFKRVTGRSPCDRKAPPV